MSDAIKIHKVDIQYNKIEALVQIGELRSIYTIPLFTSSQEVWDSVQEASIIKLPKPRTDPDIEEIQNSIKQLKLDIKHYLIKTIEEALNVD